MILMSFQPPEKAPPFKIGDTIRIISPTADRDNRGVVVEVLPVLGDFVYRYLVRFSDGVVRKFFGFELELDDSDSATLSTRSLAG